MTEAILDALGAVMTRWTMGGSALAAAPPDWREGLGKEPGEAELRLLAATGQFLGAFTRPAPAGALIPLADLPRLARPPLTDALRPRARRLMQQLSDGVARRALLDFLDARGWTLHPGDWLPRPGEDVPDVYAPWQDWAGAATAGARHASLALTAENWDDLGPAARRVALAALRRVDPAAARALLAARLGGEGADERVRLVELLAQGLSAADAPLLESLAGDRAPRVKTLAATLLARLGGGAGAADDADTRELAGFFQVQTKGLLRRSRTLVAVPLKTAAQRNRRGSLLESQSFPAFAAALGMSGAELIAAWPWAGDAALDLTFVAMAARSAPDALVPALAEQLSLGAGADPRRLLPLLVRLTAAERCAAAARLLQTSGVSFADALGIAGGCGGFDAPLLSPAGRALLQALTGANAGPNDHAGELAALGLLASQAGARAALQALAAAGLLAADPRLDMLRLNAALNPPPSSEEPKI